MVFTTRLRAGCVPVSALEKGTARENTPTNKENIHGLCAPELLTVCAGCGCDAAKHAKAAAELLEDDVLDLD